MAVDEVDLGPGDHCPHVVARADARADRLAADHTRIRMLSAARATSREEADREKAAKHVMTIASAYQLGASRSYPILQRDFNVVLVQYFESAEQMQPSKERYDAFMKAWGKAHEARTRELVKNYPAMREITGEYTMRQITFK